MENEPALSIKTPLLLDPIKVAISASPSELLLLSVVTVFIWEIATGFLFKQNFAKSFLRIAKNLALEGVSAALVVWVIAFIVMIIAWMALDDNPWYLPVGGQTSTFINKWLVGAAAVLTGASFIVREASAMNFQEYISGDFDFIQGLFLAIYAVTFGPIDYVHQSFDQVNLLGIELSKFLIALQIVLISIPFFLATDRAFFTDIIVKSDGTEFWWRHEYFYFASIGIAAIQWLGGSILMLYQTQQNADRNLPDTLIELAAVVSSLIFIVAPRISLTATS